MADPLFHKALSLTTSEEQIQGWFDKQIVKLRGALIWKGFCLLEFRGQVEEGVQLLSGSPAPSIPPRGPPDKLDSR